MFKVTFSWPLHLEDEVFVRFAEDPEDLRVLVEDLQDGGASIELIAETQ